MAWIFSGYLAVLVAIGFVVGATFVFVWRAFPDLADTVGGTLPSIVASGLSILAVSLLTGTPPAVSGAGNANRRFSTEDDAFGKTGAVEVHS